MKIKVYHNGDDVFMAWKPAGFIPACRGFALLRRRNGVEEVVSTWVGFAGREHEDGERRASTNWPIQKYQWTDYMANPGDALAYRVVPMVGPDKDNLRAGHRGASDWTETITLSHEVSPKIEAYFNRGIVAAQWVSRRLGITDTTSQTTKLQKIIETPKRSLPRTTWLGRWARALRAARRRRRRPKSACLRRALRARRPAAGSGAGEAAAKRAHVVLANGSVEKKGEDQNAARAPACAGKVDLHDRMMSPRALGHNKFLVVCDATDTPRWVWTGSQNWTKTGLCTQANNSVLIDDTSAGGASIESSGICCGAPATHAGGAEGEQQ